MPMGSRVLFRVRVGLWAGLGSGVYLQCHALLFRGFRVQHCINLPPIVGRPSLHSPRKPTSGPAAVFLYMPAQWF